MNKIEYKYTVLCYIINSYEIVREIQNPDSDVEYLLITDDPNLKSSTWKVIYDKDLEGMSVFDKCYSIRFNLFKYATTDICIYIDASILVKGSLHNLIDDFNKTNSDIGLLSHPCISTFIPELQTWIKDRNYPIEHAKRFIEFLHSMNYDLNYKSHFQQGISIRRRSKLTNDFEHLTLDHLHFIGQENLIERNDQLLADYVLNRYFNTIKVYLLSLQALESSKLQIYKHNSTEMSHIYMKFDLSIPSYAYCFNKLQKCHYIL